MRTEGARLFWGTFALLIVDGVGGMPMVLVLGGLCMIAHIIVRMTRPMKIAFITRGEVDDG